MSKNISGKSLFLQLLLAVTVRSNALKSIITFLSLSFLNLKDKFLSTVANLSGTFLNFSFSNLDFLVVKPEYVSVAKQLNIYFFFNLKMVGVFSELSLAFFLLLRDSWFIAFPDLAYIAVY